MEDLDDLDDVNDVDDLDDLNYSDDLDRDLSDLRDLWHTHRDLNDVVVGDPMCNLGGTHSCGGVGRNDVRGKFHVRKEVAHPSHP